MRRLDTSYSTLTWSADGSAVTKARPLAHRSRFAYELRVNRMLRDRRPPVRTPLLVGHEVHARTLTFEAVPGDPLGPKYPLRLERGDIDGMVDLAVRLRAFRPRRRWFRRLRPLHRLAQAGRAGLLTDGQVLELAKVARRHHRRGRFAHGDLTARNVVRSGGDLWVIDWEWAGFYPPGYEEAFLWFSLIDVPGGREQVERSVACEAPAFLLSALLVQLWHLQWFVPPEFREKHLAGRDELLGRLSVAPQRPQGPASCVAGAVGEE